MNKPVMIGFMASLLLLPMALQLANADTAGGSGTATLDATCGFGTPTVAFGNVARNTVTSPVLVTLSNTGSVTSDVQIRGSVWTGSDTLQHLTAGATSWAVQVDGDLTPGDNTYTQLTGSDAAYGVIRPLNDNSTAWKLDTNSMTNLPFNGAMTQTITFTFTCLSYS